MDVKVGSGAFLPSIDAARELARGDRRGRARQRPADGALLTDMNQVLGRTAGNAVEVRESIDHLTGAARDPRLREVTLALSAELLVLGRCSPSDLALRARRRERALDGAPPPSGSRAMVAALGGPADLLEHPERAPAGGAGGPRGHPRRAGGRRRDRRARGRARDRRRSVAAGRGRPTRSTTLSA